MVNIVSLIPLSAAQASAIRAVDPRIDLVDMGDWFNDEYAQTWSATVVDRYVSGAGHGTRTQRDALLAQADIVLCGYPFPLDLCARARRASWIQQTPAGASNLRSGDMWGSHVAVTTSRGYGETTAIAEYALAGFMHFAKSFDQSYVAGAFEEPTRRRFSGRSLSGNTLCVIGAGGIGREIARLGKALGMRVVGTRRTTRSEARDPNFDRLEGADCLHELLSESDYVAVSCQWTDATTNLLDASAFARMKAGAIVVNVARGEIIEEAALLAALDSGHVRGAVLDVFVGEFSGPPPAHLAQHPGIVLTPHTSAHTDIKRRQSIALFCTNLRRFLAGEPLENQIDWSVGY